MTKLTEAQREEFKKKSMAALRTASGTVAVDSKLVSFLYELMRDHVTPGTIEKVLIESEYESEVTYCNGFLAEYAINIAERLGAPAKSISRTPASST